MAKTIVNNIKLGVFVLAGLFFLIILLYLIGRNRNLFGSNFTIKSRFENAQGLVPGNNVRYAGIEAGTVRRIDILNDTLIEVTMVIDKKMKPFIRKNAVVAISTDGLMGNKIIAITPSREPSVPVQEGDVLPARQTVATDEMLQVLSQTNKDVAFIAGELKNTVQRINNSTALWGLLNDQTLPVNLRQSLRNVRHASERADGLVGDLQTMVADTRQGKGLLGVMLTDTSLVNDLNSSMEKISLAAAHAESLSLELDELVAGLRYQADSGKGAIHALFKDSALVTKLNNILTNIEQGTLSFNENMEALKNNFLFRGYFRKQERREYRTRNKEY